MLPKLKLNIYKQVGKNISCSSNIVSNKKIDATQWDNTRKQTKLKGIKSDFVETT